MIQVDTGTERFIYRVAGVVCHENHVLLHRAERDDFWALPGGRCELLEHSAATLRREMREELGFDVQVGRMLWVVENFFPHEGRNCHELGLYFLMSLPDGCPRLDVARTSTGDEEGLTLYFQWFPLDSLEGLELYPSFLRQELQHPPESEAHIVHHD